MILKSLILNNFRLFYGTQKFDLKNDLNVIVGANSTGKSSIVDAIKWCLYGYGNNSMLNFRAAQENNEKTLSVECKFEDESDVILINRSIIFDGENNVESNNLNVMINDKIVANPNYLINEKFPKTLYDLADGHFVDNAFMFQEIIENEYGISDLKEINHKLKVIIRDFENSIIEVAPSDNVQKRIRVLEEELMVVSEKMKETKSDIKRIEDHIKFTLDDLKVNADVNNLLNEKKNLEGELRLLEIRLNECEESLHLELIKSLPLKMLYSKISSSEKFLPYDDIDEIEFDNELNKNLFITNYSELRGIISNLKDIDDIVDLNSEINVLKAKMNHVLDRLRDIDSQLAMLPDIGPKQDLLNDLNIKREQLIQNVGMLSVKRQNLSKELKKLSEFVFDDVDSIKNNQQKLKFIYDASYSIEKLIEEINKASIQELNNSVNDYLVKYPLLKYDKVSIDENFDILLYGSEFKILPRDLSQGEYELLNLLIILAIGDLAENKFPLILDTPLARLDRKSSQLLIELFENIDVQVILLLMDMEVNDISKDYELKDNGEVEVVING